MVIRKRLEVNGPGLVFVTTTVIDWIPIFTVPSAAQATVEQLRETMTLFQASAAGYVLMPTHLHVLIGLPHIENLSRFVQTFKSLSSRRVKGLDIGEFARRLHHGRQFRMWKPRFDDVVITSEKQFRIKLEYIHNNPVRGGLVEHQAKWPYSSAGDWLFERKGLVDIDKGFSWTSG